MKYYSGIKRNEVPYSYNMGETCNHDAKLKKPVTKDSILNNSVYIITQNN